MIIKLYYYNNLIKRLIGELELTSLAEECIKDSIMQFYSAHDYTIEETDNLMMILNGIMIPFDVTLLNDENNDIVYLDVIAPNNAKEYKNVNGIKYYVNPSEKPHLHFPHVHAEYSGETIIISLADYSITGKYKTPSKQREAIAFVRKNKRKLMRLWNECINPQ